MRRLLLSVLASLLLLSAAVAEPVTLRVAVAANFKQTFDKLASAYNDPETRFAVSTGATGMLYAQITQGAPFDIFFAADVSRPAQLEQAGHIVPGSRFTYASGQLALWVPGADVSKPVTTLLREARVIALADPKIAPYGVAAREVLSRLKFDANKVRLVQGESIGQTFQFVATGHADAGFIALAQVEEAQRDREQIRKHVLRLDAKLYSPIEQQVVILKDAQDVTRAQAFLAFLRSAPGRKIITDAGYALP